MRTATLTATLVATLPCLPGCGETREPSAFTGAGGATGADDAGGGTGISDGTGDTAAPTGGDDGIDADSDDSDDDDIKFDTPNNGADDGGTPGDCECGNLDWSYAFIANSQEATMSKINTRTLEEEARYATGGLSPSRTSVSIDGRAVVVANRGVGVAKYWTRTDLCDPMANGQPGLQTSTGKNDVLPFGEDDCLAWYQDFAGMNMSVQRPVAWTPGEGECHANQKVWTTTGSGGIGPMQCGPNGVWVHRLNGDTGEIEETVHLSEAEFACSNGSGLGVGLGPYGGAVDAEGNFWFHGFGNGKLGQVRFDTLEFSAVSGGGYGITVDTKGRVWNSSSFSRYDPATGQRDGANASTSGGIAQDLQGRMWAAGQNGLVWVDMDTMAIGDTVDLPVTNQIKGVSVDIDGYIWAVAQDDPRAFKIDPDDYSWETYDGLDGPYTYSDMTGGGIFNVTCNPPEG